MATYQVVAECAHVTTEGGLKLLYKGAFVPDGQDPKRLKHLIDSGLVKEVGKDADAGLAPNAAVVPDEFATTGGAKAEVESGQAEIDRKQAEAKAKLPADGSAPDGRAGHEVWVEYAVVRGMDRDEATKAGKDEIRKALSAQK
jgi:hypothetical protein